MKERYFLLLGIISIVVIRLAVILVTPQSADLLDIRILQGTGQMVLAGINPYDYFDQPAAKESLREAMATSGVDSFTQTGDSWSYYVSSNLPANAAMLAAFEAMAQGSRFVWRLLFILGDVAIFLGLFALLKTVRGNVRHKTDQIAITFLSVLNPVLIVWGCAIPEDKQFQTALMLFSLAFFLAPKASNRHYFGMGAVLSLSVSFKLFGIFLFPLWLVRATKEWPQFAFWTVVGGLIPVALSFAAFGSYFLKAMGARGVSNTIEGPAHASPWTLFPWLSGDSYLIVKFAVVALCSAGLIALLAKRRIDLVNLCAGLGLIFACLFLDKGSLDRLNIAILLSIAALVTISTELFFSFSVIAAVVSGLAYVIGVGFFVSDPEFVDAPLVLAFLLAYLVSLTGLWDDISRRIFLAAEFACSRRVND